VIVRHVFQALEQALDDRQQVPAGVANLLQIGGHLDPARICRLVEQKLAIANDGIERRAQLVAHAAQALRRPAVGARPKILIVLSNG